MTIRTTQTSLSVTPLKERPTTKELQREESLMSKFQPETPVELRNSVRRMLDLVATVESRENMALDKVPEELRQMLDKLMNEAFALDRTLGEGVYNSLSSQKVTADYLKYLDAFINKLTALAEGGEPLSLPSDIRALLGKLDLLDGSNGRDFSAFAILKLASQFLDKLEQVALPEALQKLLLAEGDSATGSLGLLRGVIDKLMPNGMFGDIDTMGAEVTSKQPTEQVIDESINALKQKLTLLNSKYTVNDTALKTLIMNFVNDKNTPATGASSGAINNMSAAIESLLWRGGDSAELSGKLEAAVTKLFQAARVIGGGAAGIENTGLNMDELARQLKNDLVQLKISNPFSDAELTNLLRTALTKNDAAVLVKAFVMSPAEQAALDSQLREIKQEVNELVTGQAKLKSSAAGDTAGTAEGRIIVKNDNAMATPLSAAAATPVNTQQVNAKILARQIALLAEHLVSSENVSEDEREMLKTIVSKYSAPDAGLPEQDIDAIRNLLMLCEAQMPVAIRQMAMKMNLPDLAKVWTFMFMSNVSQVVNLRQQDLKRAGKALSEYMNNIKQYLSNENSSADSYKIMSFMLPLSFAEGERHYPIYAHLYHQSDDSSAGGKAGRETWLRLCVATANIGDVELIFRLYDGNNINLRCAFVNGSVSTEFNDEYLADLQQAFASMQLNLTDVKIGVLGERTYDRRTEN